MILLGVLMLSAGVGAALARSSTSDPFASRSLGAAVHDALTDPRFEARAQHYLADHGLDHPRRLGLAGASPIEVAQRTLHAEPRGGQTVADWVRLAQADHLLSLRPAPSAPTDLVSQVARLDADAGFPLAGPQRALVEAQAADLPREVRAPFASLVAATADAWEAQAPLAASLDARLATATSVTDIILTQGERDATLRNALGLIAAQNAFRDAVAGESFGQATFADPAGLVILGSSGDDTYDPTGALGDPILLVDPAGNDLYRTSAGAACPDRLALAHACNGLVVSMLVDLAGNDTYRYHGAPTDAQGAGSMGGIGILVDAAGDDLYDSAMTRTTRGPIFTYVDGGAQGYGLAGVGVLLDAAGDDVYRADVTSAQRDIWDLAQGFGNAGGIGIAADASGDDAWLADGYDSKIPACAACSMQGLYPGGTGFYAGIGVLADTGAGDDAYHGWDNATTTDFYAYGFGAFGGTGIFYEDGGNDDYAAVESATDPNIVPLLNCAFGTASFAGLGVFLEMGGNDHYFGDTRSPHAAWTMNEGFGGPAEGEGVFLDVSGDDGHFMQAHSADGQGFTTGRGVLLNGGEGATGNTLGAFLDLGGADSYIGAPPSRDNAVWPAGVDFDAGLAPQFFLK